MAQMQLGFKEMAQHLRQQPGSSPGTSCSSSTFGDHADTLYCFTSIVDGTLSLYRAQQASTSIIHHHDGLQELMDECMDLQVPIQVIEGVLESRGVLQSEHLGDMDAELHLLALM